jgi:hypothetical protein
MTKKRLDAAVRGAIANLNGAAEWLEEVAAGTRFPQAKEFRDHAAALTQARKTLEDSWA